jgi:hypothetical protein
VKPSTTRPGHDSRFESLGRYFLFAGRHTTSGGLGDLVDVFVDEAVARAAFAAVRLQRDGRAEWAELAVVDAQGSIRLLCWFGHDRPVPHHGRLAGAPSIRPAGRRRLRRAALALLSPRSAGFREADDSV